MPLLHLAGDSMKASEIIEEVLEENEDYKKLNKVQKLVNRTAIKRVLGSNDMDVPPELEDEIKQQLKAAIAGMPLTED